MQQIMGNPQEFLQKFREFASNFQQNHKGITPQQMVQNLLNSGKMTQAQFNQYRDIANKLTGMNF